MIAKLIYILCALTAGICALLLFRGYRRSGMRLLLWSSVCFLLLTIANVGVYVDLVMLPEVDFAEPRAALTLLAMMALLLGMIFETN